MISLLVLTVSAVAIVWGRRLCGRWFNPVTAYTAPWGAALALGPVGLIHYHAIVPAAWGFMGLAFAQFLVGSAVGATMNRPMHEVAAPPPLKRLRIAVLILCAAAAAALLLQWLAIFRNGGSLLTALVRSIGERYAARARGTLGGEIPYLGTFALAACPLAGVLAARAGRFSLVSLLPLVVTALQSITSAGRLIAMLGLAFFGAGFLATPSFLRQRIRVSRTGLVIGLVVGVGLAGGSFALISATRGLQVDFPGTDPRMHALSRWVPVAPSLYANVATPPVAYSEFLKAGAPSQGFAAYTFAPAWRLLRRFKIGGGVPALEENYYTPVPSNVATYLKNVQSDFGPAGVALFPFLLGALATALAVKVANTGRLSTTAIYAAILTVVVLSFNYNIMVAGDWALALAVSWLAALLVERPAQESDVADA